MFYRILNINEENIDEIIKCVSEERIKKSEKFKHEADRKRSICVEYLLNSMIKEYYPQIDTPVSLTYDENEKPHIYYSSDDKRDVIHFSLSHSGDYVACIISDKPCGIDIEKYSDRRRYEKIIKRVCTEIELGMIKSTEDFYNVWTLKESVLKAVGLGFSLDMRAFDLKRAAEKNEGSLSYGVFTTVVNGISYTGQTVEAPQGYALSYMEEKT